MLTQPDISPTEDGYVLDADYVYEWTHESVRRRLTVLAGFAYDGNSVPRWAWSLAGILPDGLNRAAGLVHDALYRHQGRLSNSDVTYQYLLPSGETYGVKALWPRRDVDRLYGRMLREAGYPKRKRRLSYLAVRLGGRKAWRD